jgi:hypothetical protein
MRGGADTALLMMVAASCAFALQGAHAVTTRGSEQLWRWLDDPDGSPLSCEDDGRREGAEDLDGPARGLPCLAPRLDHAPRDRRSATAAPALCRLALAAGMPLTLPEGARCN